MVLTSSGPISFHDIAIEFGGNTSNISFHDYFVGVDTLYTDGTSGIPGPNNPISLHQFLGKGYPMYPPVNFNQSYAYTVSGSGYGDGYYSYTATTERNGGGTCAFAFSTDGNFWQLNPFYPQNNYFSGNNYYGDFVQITFPRQVRVFKYSLYTSNINNPNQWALGASNDGSNWTFLDYRDFGAITMPNWTTYSYYVSNPGHYQYFKFVYMRSDGAYPALQGLKIY